MDIGFILLSTLFVIIGVVFMIRNRFYRYNLNDSLFLAELKLFLGGVLFFLLGSYGLYYELSTF
jgi:hypothetical protein